MAKTVRFLHHVTLFGIGYRPGDAASFGDDFAGRLIDAYLAIDPSAPAPPETIPDPLPQYLLDADLTTPGSPLYTALSAAGSGGGGSATIDTIPNLRTTLDAKAPLASPSFTGVPTGVGVLTESQRRVAVTALEDGGLRISSASFPIVGYGGSSSALNPASPTLLDLPRYGVTRMLWMPGVAGNVISTPDSAGLSGNVAGAPQALTLNARVVTHEGDPIPSQGYYFLGGKPGCWLLQLVDDGHVEIRVKDSANGSTTQIATSTVAVPAKSLVDIYVTWTPANSSGVWQADFATSLDGGATMQTLGDPVTGTAPTGPYYAVSGATQGIVVGQQGNFGSMFVGGLLRFRVATSTPGAGGTVPAWGLLTTRGDFNPSSRSADDTSWADPQGNTWTIANLQTGVNRNWVSTPSLAVFAGEYLTVGGSQVLTTPGVYAGYTGGGVTFDVTRPSSLIAYRSNAVNNVAAPPALTYYDITVDAVGRLVATSMTGVTTQIAGVY